MGVQKKDPLGKWSHSICKFFIKLVKNLIKLVKIVAIWLILLVFHGNCGDSIDLINTLKLVATQLILSFSNCNCGDHDSFFQESFQSYQDSSDSIDLNNFKWKLWRFIWACQFSIEIVANLTSFFHLNSTITIFFSLIFVNVWFKLMDRSLYFCDLWK